MHVPIDAETAHSTPSAHTRKLATMAEQAQATVAVLHAQLRTRTLVLASTTQQATLTLAHTGAETEH